MSGKLRRIYTIRPILHPRQFQWAISHGSGNADCLREESVYEAHQMRGNANLCSLLLTSFVDFTQVVWRAPCLTHKRASIRSQKHQSVVTGCSIALTCASSQITGDRCPLTCLRIGSFDHHLLRLRTTVPVQTRGKEMFDHLKCCRI